MNRIQQLTHSHPRLDELGVYRLRRYSVEGVGNLEPGFRPVLGVRPRGLGGHVPAHVPGPRPRVGTRGLPRNQPRRGSRGGGGEIWTFIHISRLLLVQSYLLQYILLEQAFQRLIGSLSLKLLKFGTF